MERIDKRSKKWKNMSQEEKDNYESQRINGGKRANAGRKPKVEEQELVERLSPLDEKGFKALENGLDDGQHWAVKLFLEYRYGKAKQIIEQNNTHNFNEDFDITKLYGKDR